MHRNYAQLLDSFCLIIFRLHDIISFLSIHIKVSSDLATLIVNDICAENECVILLQFQEAKNTFLLACKRSPSCVSWLGVGIACYRVRM